MTSQIEPGWDEARRRHSKIAVDNDDLLQTSPKETGNHHHRYANGNSITISTKVRGSEKVANEISNPQPETE